MTIRMIIFLILATAGLAAGLFLLSEFVFSDVLSYALEDTDAQSWWRQLAFLTEALAWASAELAALFAFALASLVWKRRSVRAS